MSAFVECPACQRRLTLRPGHAGTFKASCVHDGCGAPLLCDVVKGQLTVQGPSKLHEAERVRELEVRASSSLRSFWAPGMFVVFTLGTLAFYVLPFAFAGFGAVIGFLVLVAFLAAAALIMVLFWIRARIVNEAAEPLREIEGALDAWSAPEGYRG